MNQLHPASLQAAHAAAQARFSHRIAALLDEQTETLGADLVSRLEFARSSALQRARSARARTAGQRLGTTAGGAAILGFDGGRGATGWWMRLASLAPLIALVAGLVVIQQAQTRAQVSVAAEVDAALLSDDLPPTAYGDAAFGEFLKLPPRN